MNMNILWLWICWLFGISCKI